MCCVTGDPDDVTVLCPQRDNLPRGAVLLRERDTGMSLRRCHAMARTLHPPEALPETPYHDDSIFNTPGCKADGFRVVAEGAEAPLNRT